MCPDSEQEILREEIQSLQAVKTRLKSRVSELEEELKKSKEELEKAKASRGNAEEGEEVCKAGVREFSCLPLGGATNRMAWTAKQRCVVSRIRNKDQR